MHATPTTFISKLRHDLHALRIEKRWTQETIAELTGAKSAQIVGAFERGESLPREDVLDRLVAIVDEWRNDDAIAPPSNTPAFQSRIADATLKAITAGQHQLAAALQTSTRDELAAREMLRAAMETRNDTLMLIDDLPDTSTTQTIAAESPAPYPAAGEGKNAPRKSSPRKNTK